MSDSYQVGERIAYHRRRLGLSQVEFAALIGRSESWVSQIERGVRAIDRMSVLQRVADVLSVSVAELQGDDETPAAEERPEAFDTIRLALTGHPAVGLIVGDSRPAASAQMLDKLRRQHAGVWDLVHASKYTELAPTLAALIPGLEIITRQAKGEQVRAAALDLLGDTYQATAALMAKLEETDAAWIAADRAASCAEKAGEPLGVAASMFRMAHVFLVLGRMDQAQHVAASTAQALEPRITDKPAPEVLSLYGGLHLVLAVAAARDTTAAWPACTSIPRGRLPKNSARTATTTEPSSDPPTWPSTPCPSRSNSATPGKPSNSASRPARATCRPNGRPATTSTWPRLMPCAARSAKPQVPTHKSRPRHPMHTVRVPLSQLADNFCIEG